MRKICLFAQYTAGPSVQPYVFHYLFELCRAGYAVHVALSGKTRILDADRQRFEELGVQVMKRPNTGHDFGAWAALIQAGAADGADEILLANDSVIGPFAPLAPIIRAMAGYDSWGMVLSREGRPHLQSWFVAMSGAAFRSAAVRRVFAQDFAAMRKAEIVVHGELGLGAAFEAEGLDVGARYRAEFRLRPSRLLALNPMHFRWRELIEEGRVPFLKVELVRDNPAAIIGASRWRSVTGFEGETGFAEAPGPRLSLRQVLLQTALRERRVRLARDALSALR